MSPMPIPQPEELPAVEERLHRMVQRWPQVSGYHLNPDPSIVEGIVQALVRSTMRYGYAYCPCRDLTGDHNVDKVNVCPCRFHRDEIARDGHCKCVLYVGDNYDPVEAYRPKESDTAVRGAAVHTVRERQVTVYVTNWCAQSRRMRAFLQERGVPFEVVDIERDPAAARKVEVWNSGFRSVPVLVARLVVTEPSIAELTSLLLTPRATIDDLHVYITRWCGQSRRVVNWLEEQGIAAEVIDIERDLAAAEKVQRWNLGLQSVPTLDLTLRSTEPSMADVERLLGLSVS